MELRQLRYFARIVELGSLSKAAASLYVAQPALSKHVAALERELGCALLVRSVRGVQPTEAGVALYREAQALLRRLARLPDEVASAATSPTGTVAIGIPASTSTILSAPLVAAVAASLPRIRLAITEGVSGHLEELLGSGRLDFALLFERRRPARPIEARRLLVEDLVLVTRRDRRGADGAAEVTLAEAARERFILPAQTNATRQLVDQAFARAGLALELAAEVDAPSTMIAMAAAGLGATIVSRSALHPRPERPSLAVRRIVRPQLARGLDLCTNRSAPPGRGASRVLDEVGRCIRGLVERGVWQGARLAER